MHTKHAFWFIFVGVLHTCVTNTCVKVYLIVIHWRKLLFMLFLDCHFKLQIHIQVSVTYIRIDWSIIGFHWKWLMIANRIRPPTLIAIESIQFVRARASTNINTNFSIWNVHQSYEFVQEAQILIICVWIDNNFLKPQLHYLNVIELYAFVLIISRTWDAIVLIFDIDFNAMCTFWIGNDKTTLINTSHTACTKHITRISM